MKDVKSASVSLLSYPHLLLIELHLKIPGQSFFVSRVSRYSRSFVGDVDTLTGTARVSFHYVKMQDFQELRMSFPSFRQAIKKRTVKRHFYGLLS